MAKLLVDEAVDQDRPSAPEASLACVPSAIDLSTAHLRHLAYVILDGTLLPIDRLAAG